MVREAVAALALLIVSGCASVIDGIYDDQARKDCDQADRDRGACHDRVDQSRRERDRQD